MADNNNLGNFELAKQQARVAVSQSFDVATVDREHLEDTISQMHRGNQWAQEIAKSIGTDENYQTTLISTKGLVEAMIIDYKGNGYTMRVRDGKTAPVFGTTDNGLKITPRGMGLSKSTEVPLDSGKTFFIQADNGVDLDLSGHKASAEKHNLRIQVNYHRLGDKVHTPPNIIYGPNTAGVDIVVRSGANITMPASLAQSVKNGYTGKSDGSQNISVGTDNKIAFVPSQDKFNPLQEEYYSVNAYIHQPDGKAKTVPLYTSGERRQDDFQQAITEAAKPAATVLGR